MFGPYQALLFDMDGTLLTSKGSIDRSWGAWAERHGLPASEVVEYLRGRRASDAIDHFLPGISPEQRRQELDWVELLEMADTTDVSEVPGAGKFLMSLPSQRWAVTTSAARRLAIRRMEAAGLPIPAVLVAAEDVAVGKPDPSGYLLAANRLSFDSSRCLIFEDAPNGVAAGLASHAAVAVVASPNEKTNPAISFYIDDYRNLAVDVQDDGLAIRRG
jgi:mannitol-1-/sugar-/sorbitol-6-phosphatase